MAQVHITRAASSLEMPRHTVTRIARPATITRTNWHICVRGERAAGTRITDAYSAIGSVPLVVGIAPVSDGP